jgi:hypothetical protein
MATSLLLPDSTFEDHYSIADLARQWRISRESVRLLIMNEPGVIRLSGGRKKKLCRYSIPASVARRVHTRLTAPVAAAKAA